MDEGIKSYITINAFLGYKFLIDENLGLIEQPRMDDLKENLFIYLHLVNQNLDLYEDTKPSFYTNIISSQKNFDTFTSMLFFFFNSKAIEFKDFKIYINETNYIDENNVFLFMETIKVLHHRDKKDDDYIPANKIAAEMMERAKKLRKELEAKMNKKDGIGFLEIMSTVSARHPSINPTNIGQLNYYQIVEQYNRLMAIDLYTPCLYGNATEEYIKKNNVKHYSLKLVND